jgi:hypothetical protein
LLSVALHFSQYWPAFPAFNRQGGRNMLTGSLPTELLGSPNLRTLHLGANNLEGTLPTTFSPKLIELFVIVTCFASWDFVSDFVYLLQRLKSQSTVRWGASSYLRAPNAEITNASGQFLNWNAAADDLVVLHCPVRWRKLQAFRHH